jgi:hypothetical protein
MEFSLEGIGTLEFCNMAVYSSNSDDGVPTLLPQFDGSAYNISGARGQLEGKTALSWQFGGSSQSFPMQSIPLNLARVQARAGLKMSFVFGSDLELTGAGAAYNGSNAGKSSGFQFGSVFPRLILT